jgi:hypothetical protein
MENPMKKFSLALLLLLCASSVTAQNFRSGKVYNTNGGEISIVPRSQLTYRYTWYGPDIFQYPNGELGFLAHSNNPSVDRYGNSDAMSISTDACGAFKPAGIDSIYSARRSASGTWQTPAFGQCPKFKGMTRRCTYDPDAADDPNVPWAVDIDPVGSPSVVRIANPYSSTGYRYYVAFNNGNSDFFTGKLYWAVSDDGDNWTVHTSGAPAGYQWKPVIGPEYHDCEDSAGEIKSNQGVVEPFLAFDPNDTAGGINPNGTFYLYFTYTHYLGVSPEGNPIAYEDALAFRFGYNPAHPFGFGTNPQLYYRNVRQDSNGDGVLDPGQWIPHSGRLVWSYDTGPQINGEPKLEIAHSMLSWRESQPEHALGRGDLKQNPDTGNWYHISTWGNRAVIQSSMSLATDDWSSPTVVNLTTINNLYQPRCYGGPHPITGQPTYADVAYDPGLWYGTLGTRRGWWIWTPVHAAAPAVTNQTANPEGLASCFQGLAFVVAKLCENNEAGCDS